MTWTYDTSLLASSSLMKVRLMIGDNDTTRQQLADEEINYVLTYETSPTMAAAIACDLLAGKYSFQMNTENGALRISAAARMKHYMDLADRLRAGGAGDMPGDPVIINATMSVAGVSQAAKDAINEDTDAVVSPFRLGQDDRDGTTEDDDWTGV